MFRGKWSDAAISFVAMIPAIGDSLKGIKYLDEAAALLKYGDEVVSISKGTAKDAASKAIKNIKKEAIGVINKGENASKGILEATMDIGKDDYVLFLNNKIDTKVNLVTDGINTKGQAIVVGGCLIGDTLVFTDKGFKEIRDISIDDLVLSKNEESEVVEYKKVIETHRNSTYKSCIIRTKNSIIESTTGHLFMVKDKWWTAAIDIKEKDLIEVSNNTYEEIIEVEIKDSEYPIVTYNLTIEDNHTYYTGYDKTLTHNMGKINPCFKGASETDDILIQRHGTLKNNKDIPGQSHHLNQDAAFRDVIPREEGMAIKLEGNIFTDIGSPHYNAHKSMEEFWSKYRKAGELYGSQPQMVEYNKALYEALQNTGLSKEQSIQAMREAVKQQLDYGLSSKMDVPRIPGKINLK